MRKIFYNVFLFLILFCFFPFIAKASVVISEIAWMGNSSNANAEWIELYNNGSEDIDLSGFTISGSVSITIPSGKSIVGGGFFLLERTSDGSVPEITADHIYTGALANTGGNITLKDGGGVMLDEVLYPSGWPAGSNDTKETMQKIGNSWATASPSPKANNTQNTASNSDDTNNTTNNSNTNTNTTTSNSNTSSNTKTPAYKDMVAKIIVNQSIVPLNAPATLKPEIFGHYGEKVEKGKIIWNFGDGVIKEAASFEIVYHKYKRIGDYTVSLQYFENNKKEEPDLEKKISIKVVPSQVIISRIGDLNDPYVEIENKSSYEISLKDWKLIAGGKSFSFPAGTYITPNRKIMFGPEVTNFSEQDFRVIVLMRPGFEVEDVYPDDLSFLPDNIDNFKTTSVGYTRSHEDFSNSQKEKEIFIDQDIDSGEVLDLRGLSGQEANAVSSSNINPTVLLVLIIVFGLVGVFFIKKWKIQKNTDEMSHLSSDDIKIIE